MGRGWQPTNQRGVYSSLPPQTSHPSFDESRINIELSNVTTIDDTENTKHRPSTTNSDAYYFDGKESSGDLNSIGENSLEDEYEVYAVHASSKSAVRTCALTSLAIVSMVPIIVVTIHHFIPKATFNGQRSGSFPAVELFGNGYSDDFRENKLVVKDEHNLPPYDIDKDFRNEDGISPPYWGEIEQIVNPPNKYGNTLGSLSSWGPCYPSTNNQSTPINWREQVLAETPNRYTDDGIRYPNPRISYSLASSRSSFFAGNNDSSSNPNLAGLCRPSFLIIGQAKCGTSSLYHYLCGHPRVLPASEKQINYFKYVTQMPMQWYLSHFPPIETFLARGALMSGESSPSYFPYPTVPHLLHERMRVAKDGESSGAYPKIIAIVRDPISRSMSSYEYNYVQPALKLIQNKSGKREPKSVLDRIPEGKSDEYYREHHLFSFEELVRSELMLLKECLHPVGVAEVKSREQYGSPNGIFADAYNKRDASPDSYVLPLLNADEFCYGDTISDAVPLAQWSDLVREYPDKLIAGVDIHLVRSIVGRSIYAHFLNWWYERFTAEDILVVCTEDLHFRPNETLSYVASFLGLPAFDFSDVVAEGMYNVGFHTGYDTVTSWEDIGEEEAKEEDEDISGAASNVGYEVHLSDELRSELVDFFRQYNEALFELSGKRCPWDE